MDHKKERGSFFFKSNSELPIVAFLLKKIHSPLLIYNQLCLECSGVTIKKTSWGGSKKFEDIAFENTQTFSVPNGKI